MTKTEFETMVAAYGANPLRWPDDRRGAAKIFAATHPEAHAILRSEADLDAALDSVRNNDPSEILRARIMKSANGNTAQTNAPIIRKRPIWQAIAAVFVAAMVIGFVGVKVSAPSPESPSEETVWLEAANDLGVSDVYAWVEGTDTSETGTP